MEIIYNDENITLLKRMNEDIKYTPIVTNMNPVNTKLKRYNNEYYQKNKDRLKDKQNEYSRNYYQNNKEKVKIRNLQNYYTKKNSTKLQLECPTE